MHAWKTKFYINEKGSRGSEATRQFPLEQGRYIKTIEDILNSLSRVVLSSVLQCFFLKICHWKKQIIKSVYAKYQTKITKNLSMVIVSIQIIKEIPEVYWRETVFFQVRSKHFFKYVFKMVRMYLVTANVGSIFDNVSDHWMF